jgi:hypothetical protein
VQNQRGKGWLETAFCGQKFDSEKGVEIHRKGDEKGYSRENCVLVHRECHEKLHSRLVLLDFFGTPAQEIQGSIEGKWVPVFPPLGLSKEVELREKRRQNYCSWSSIEVKN